MVEIIEILHEHQSKFESSSGPPYAYVGFFRMYDRFPGNVDGLACQNMNIYWATEKTSKKHQSKYLRKGPKFFSKNFIEIVPRVFFTMNKTYRA